MNCLSTVIDNILLHISRQTAEVGPVPNRNGSQKDAGNTPLKSFSFFLIRDVNSNASLAAFLSFAVYRLWRLNGNANQTTKATLPHITTDFFRGDVLLLGRHLKVTRML